MYSYIYIKVISFLLFIFSCNVTRYGYVNRYRNNQNTDKYNTLTIYLL